MEENHPLLPTSVIFDGANLTDCIRQLYIDLNDIDDSKQVEELLQETIEYLFYDISYDFANELIFLILKCFKHLSTDPLPHLNVLYKKSKNSSYSIITFISVLSYLINNKTDLDYTNFNEFVNDGLNEIREQIQDQNQLILFSHEIPFQFRDDVIFDFLLSANLSAQLVDDFFDFCKNNNNDLRNNKKLEILYSKISNAGFVTSSFLSADTLFYRSKQKNDFYIRKKDIKSDIIIDLYKIILNLNLDFNEEHRKKFIKHMLKDKTNMLGYFQIIFENLPKEARNPLDLLSYFNEEYELSKEDFIKILDNVFVYHHTKNIFVPRPQYRQLNLDVSESNEKLINDLFNVVTFDPTFSKAFSMLKIMAMSFPFIFQSNPRRLFEALLPAFDNIDYIFYFENEIQRTENEICFATISAISTLLYALNSTKVFDAFIPWFFENVEEMSLNQIFCMILIFETASTTLTIDLQVAMFQKYGLFETISKILLRKVPDNFYGENFNKNLYTFLQIQHSISNDLSKTETILIGLNKKRENAFFEFSGRKITHSIDFIGPLFLGLFCISKEYGERVNKIPFGLIQNNEKLLPTWTIKSRTKKQKISQQQVIDFIQLYKKLTIKHNVAEKQSFPDFKEETKICNIKKIMKFDPWVIDYIIRDTKFPLLEEHSKILTEAFEILSDNKEEEEIEEFDQITIKDFDKDEYFISYREDDNFMKNLLDRITNNCFKPIQHFKKYLEVIQINEKNQIIIFQTIYNNIQYIVKNEVYYSPSACQYFKWNLEFLGIFIQNALKNKEVKKQALTKFFFDNIENNLINVILTPQFRENNIILKEHYKILCFFSNYPNQVLHIIEFMLLSGNNYLKKGASTLCFGFKNENSPQIFQILDSYFVDELNSENPCRAFISNVLRLPNTCGNVHKFDLMNLLKKSLQKYKEKGEDEEDEKEDINLKDFIINLLDFLSPDRDKSNSICLSDSIMTNDYYKDDKFRFLPIPEYIYNISPQFWSVFEEYRQVINEILHKEYKQNTIHDIPTALFLIVDISVKQFSSRLVSNFPECFSFDFRSTFFLQIIHDDLNINLSSMINDIGNLELLRYMIDNGYDLRDDLKLEIDPTKIYEDSFQQLNSKEPNEWKKIIKISYLNNEGVDTGGLLKDWFTKLSLEIFNPIKGLFDVTEKNNIWPSRGITAKSKEGLEKIKFAGMIVARALMQGILIPVYFTKPFLKQILHHDSEINEKDLEDVNETIYNSLEFYKSLDFNKHPEVDIRFEINTSYNEIVELKPNGSQIQVNNENKEEYIKLYTQFFLIESIKQQVNAFCEGFDSLVPHEKIRMFTPTELCVLISGVPKFNVDDLMKSVEYGKPYDAENPVVKLFFETIKKWDEENLAKLILFITGTTNVPVNELKQLKKPIRIEYGGDSSRLPCAQTCINTLKLPAYKTEDEMNSKLLMAINVNDFLLK